MQLQNLSASPYGSASGWLAPASLLQFLWDSSVRPRPQSQGPLLGAAEIGFLGRFSHGGVSAVSLLLAVLV